MQLLDKNSGEIYVKVGSQAFFVGQGNWGGPKGPATVNYPPPKDKKPDYTYTKQLTAESALLYRLNGDYNPLHATPEPGAAMGFGGAIMHGLSSWNYAAHGILREIGGGDPANIKSFQARFAAPVLPGEKLILEAWRTGTVDSDGFEEIRFTLRVEGKKVVLSNGKADVKVVGKAASKL
jgi:peroxisomal enoyl-CoA hydratase 2